MRKGRRRSRRKMECHTESFSAGTRARDWEIEADDRKKRKVLWKDRLSGRECRVSCGRCCFTLKRKNVQVRQGRKRRSGREEVEEKSLVCVCVCL